MIKNSNMSGTLRQRPANSLSERFGVLIVAIRFTLLLLIACAVIYPLIVLAIAKIMPGKGLGEIIVDGNGAAHFANIGQRFDSPRYFHTRPSAVNYNAAGSGGSNKSPFNPDYLVEVQARVQAFKSENPASEVVPVEMVTASGSGLDPHISPLAASTQVARVAKARNMEQVETQKIINRCVEKSFFGPVIINVLKLNIELDKNSN